MGFLKVGSYVAKTAGRAFTAIAENRLVTACIQILLNYFEETLHLLFPATWGEGVE